MSTRERIRAAACVSATALTLSLGLPAFAQQPQGTGPEGQPGSVPTHPTQPPGDKPKDQGDRPQGQPDQAVKQGGDRQSGQAKEQGQDAGQGRLTQEEMRQLVEEQGLLLPPPFVVTPPPSAQTGAESPDSQGPGDQAAGMRGMTADELKGYFEVLGSLSPEQQTACFGVAKWQAAATMPPRIVAAPVPPPMPFAPWHPQCPGCMPR